MKLSVLNLVPLRADGDNQTAIAQMVALAQHVEALGYERYWIAEHHNMVNLASSATSILIGQTLANTQHIRVGSGGVMLPNHSPLIVAEQYGTLATIYPNRVDLGLGRAPGTDQETAQALRRSNVETAYTFGDDVVTLGRYLGDATEQGRVRANPGVGTHVPRYILGSSTDSAHLAARLGLPYAFAANFAPAQLEAALAIYRAEFQPSPALDKPYVIVCVNVIAAEDDASAQFLRTTQQQAFLGIVTNRRRPLQPPVDSMDGLWDVRSRYMVEQMTACSLVGGKATLRHQLDALQRTVNADELMAVSYIYDEALQHQSYTLLRDVVAG